MYLFIHGFTSSSHSTKAQYFRRWLTEQGREKEWVCPDLPINPTEAMTVLSNIIKKAELPVKLIGSSLGGFYATLLAEQYGLKAVLINPAVNAGLILRRAIGPHQAWHSDQQLLFTQAHVDALNEMSPLELTAPENLFLMLEKGDETLDWRSAAAFYRDCHQLIYCGGDHSFTRFGEVLDTIDHFHQ